MAKAKRKNTTQLKNPNAELFKLHARFCAAYAKVKKYADMPGRDNGSGPSGTAEEKRIHRKWEGALGEAFDAAHIVMEAPAFTLEGILTKLHVAGFGNAVNDTFTDPHYRAGDKVWEPGRHLDDGTPALLISLRDDLRRFAGRAS